MATVEELKQALSHINVQTGNGNAWRNGLSFPDQRAIAEWRKASGGEVPDTLIGALRNHHPELFSSTGALRFPSPTAGVHEPAPAAPQPAPAAPANNEQNGQHANGGDANQQNGNGKTGQQGNGAATNKQNGNGQTGQQGSGDQEQKGDGAEAIKKLEAALKDQNSDVAEADRTLATAVLSAYSKSVAGKEKLEALQQSIEDAVQRQTALDTPMGAREFQKFLVSKQREIIDTVVEADLDDKTKREILSSLYTLSSTPGQGNGKGDNGKPEGENDKGGGENGGQGGGDGGQGGQGGTPPTQLDGAPGGDLASLLNDPSLMGADPGLLGGGMPPMPQIPTPPMPSLGGGGIPGLFGGGGSGAGGLGDLLNPKSGDKPESGLDPLLEPLGPSDKTEPEPLIDPKDHDKPEGDPEKKENEQPVPGTPVPGQLAPPIPPGAGPTEVHLKYGDKTITLTAPNPQMAEVTKAIANGTPIGEAFREHAGVSVAPAGAAVPNPEDPSKLQLGAIGQFADHQVYALSKDLGVLNGQIRPISELAGPGFLGWLPPPDIPTAAPTPQAAAPAAPAVAPTATPAAPVAPAAAPAPAAGSNLLTTPSSRK